MGKSRDGPPEGISGFGKICRKSEILRPSLLGLGQILEKMKDEAPPGKVRNGSLRV